MRKRRNHDASFKARVGLPRSSLHAKIEQYRMG